MRSVETQLPDVDDFFKQVLIFAQSRVDQALVLRFMDRLEKQIYRWLSNPPENAEYAAQVMEIILGASLPNDEDLFPVKARLSFLKGLIREKGFDKIPPDTGQALLDFQSACVFGSIEAWEHIGDIQFSQALKEPPPVSRSDIFAQAAESYSKGTAAARTKYVENSLMQAYRDAITQGDFRAALTGINTILNYLRDNPGLPVNRNIYLLEKQIPVLIKLQSLIDDAKKIEAQYLLVQLEKDPDKMERLFLQVKDQLKLPDEANPVIDFYYANTLRTIARLKQSLPGTAEQVQHLYKRAEIFYEHMLQDGAYPDSCWPLLNYVKGLGKESNIKSFMPLPVDTFVYYQSAARQGCYLAFGHMGRIKDTETKFSGAQYYAAGAKAGDFHSQYYYYNQYFLPKIESALHAKEPNSNQIADLAEQAVDLLTQALNNPYIMEKYRHYLVGELAKTQRILTIHGNFPVIFDIESSWKQYRGREELNPLFAALEQYRRIEVDKYKERIIALKKIAKLGSTLAAKPNMPEQLLQLLKELQSKTQSTLHYVNKKKYEHKMRELANMRGWDRIRKWVKFREQKGRLQMAMYQEHIDPMHRKMEFFQKDFKKWQQSPTSKNLYQWVLDTQGYNPDEVHTVVYMDKEDRKNLHVTRDAWSRVHYDATMKVVPDGIYLYALDFKSHLYMDEKREEGEELLHFHHSSFKSGKPVLCGGEMVVKDGKIIKIDNYSGHYLPDIGRLAEAIRRLLKDGRLHRNVRVKVVGLNELPPGIRVDMDDMSLDEFFRLHEILKQQLPQPVIAEVEAPKLKAPPTEAQRSQMRLIATEIENYAREESLQHLANYPELKASPEFAHNLWQYLMTDRKAGEAVTKAFAVQPVDSGMLSTLLLNMPAINERSLLEFAAGYNRAIEEGKFVEWTFYLASSLLAILLDEHKRLRPQIALALADRIGISKEQLLERLYGKPEEAEKVKETANTMLSACIFCISGMYTTAIEKGNAADAPEELQKLLRHKGRLTGMRGPGLIDEDLVTFKKLAVCNLDNYESMLRDISATRMIELEVQALRAVSDWARKQVDVIKDNKVRQGTGLFSQNAMGVVRYIQTLQAREAIFLGIMRKSQPRKATHIAGLKEKLKFYVELLALFNEDSRDVKGFSHQLSNIESLMTDEKQFNARCKGFDELLFQSLSSLCTAKLGKVVGNSCATKLAQLNTEFYKICNRGRYEDSLQGLISGLSELGMTIKAQLPRELGPSRLL